MGSIRLALIGALAAAATSGCALMTAGPPGPSRTAGHAGPVAEDGGTRAMATPRLYRVIVPVGDLERAVRFYGELLGSEGMRVSGGRHYFDCGGVVLALLWPKGDGDADEPRPLPDHLYFAVADLESVFARAKRLGALSTETGDGGLPMGEIATRPWGERSFYLRDPFGTPLCFVDEKTLFTGG